MSLHVSNCVILFCDSNTHHSTLHNINQLTLQHSHPPNSSAMAQKLDMLSTQTHFVFVPLMAPGHLLPLVDLARLLARRDVKVTILTTPLNAIRVRANIDRDVQSGSPIQLQLLQFPNAQAGIPEGCESFDTLPSMDLRGNFLGAMDLLQHPLEQLFENLAPTPTCIISDKHIPCVTGIAKKFNVPRIVFDGTSCFTLLCNHTLYSTKAYEKVSDSEPFIIPGLPDRVEFRRSQLPGPFNDCTKQVDVDGFREKVREAEKEAYGVVVNSFQELEAEYVKEYKRVTGHKVWCVGPVSLSNKDNVDMAQRGKRDSNFEEGQYVKWLDSWPARSVIYVCLGSLNRLPPEQLMEIGLGLEATKRAFIWVLRGAYKREETEKLIMEDGLEERVRGRGVIIRGWAPQMLILSHTAIGAFLTHCGWNSTLEGICSGVPLVTFPLFAEQFYNEKVVVQVVETGVRVGAQKVLSFGNEDKFGIPVKREDVKEAIENVMGESKESDRIRERARQIADKAKKAMEKDGSSYLNMSLLIEDITQHVKGFNQAQPQQSPNE